jgi:hypothetical protein
MLWLLWPRSCKISTREPCGMATTMTYRIYRVLTKRSICCGHKFSTMEPYGMATAKEYINYRGLTRRSKSCGNSGRRPAGDEVSFFCVVTIFLVVLRRYSKRRRLTLRSISCGLYYKTITIVNDDHK